MYTLMSDINVNISRMVSYIRWKILMREFIILKNFDIIKTVHNLMCMIYCYLYILTKV